MSKTLIRVKNNDYPYFTEGYKRENGKLLFEIINKKGERRSVELAESEVVVVETLLTDKNNELEDETEVG